MKKNRCNAIIQMKTNRFFLHKQIHLVAIFVDMSCVHSRKRKIFTKSVLVLDQITFCLDALFSAVDQPGRTFAEQAASDL